ncbi:MAG: beta-lactamase family protein [Ignavibacteriaceae bacterium]|nr:beta-lactamase family protein [Ignavibacteriaceae bacterium]
MTKISQSTLDSLVTQTASKKNIHGAVLRVSSTDSTIDLVSAAGNLVPESKFYIASINKFLISFITLRLSFEGKLSLNDKINRYIDSKILAGISVFKNKDFTNEITIKHLISHTSGLPCYLIDKMPDGRKNMDLILSGNDQSWEFEKVLAVIKRMSPKFIPGTEKKAAYSETNFRIMDRIIEVLLNKQISDVLSELFLELEMSDTFVLPHTVLNVAPVYHKDKKISLEKYWKSTGHDLASTSADLLKFLRAFFEGKYLPKENISDLKEWNNIFFPFKYGIGLQKFYMPRILSPFKALPEIIGHCGSVGSIAFYIPDKKCYITGTVNQTGNPNTVFQTLIKIVNKL